VEAERITRHAREKGLFRTTVGNPPGVRAPGGRL